MKNSILLNRLGFNPDLTTRQSRVDSVSIASRYRVLGIIMLCLLTLGVGSAWGATVTISPSDTWTHSGTSGTGSTTDITKSGITFTTGKGYKDGTAHVRVYSGGEITISSTVGSITKIEFTSTASGTSSNGPAKISLKGGQSGAYSYSGKLGTWTYASGSTSVTFSASAQFRFTQVVVTYAASEVSKTSITGLDYVYGSGPSAAQSFNVSATNVTGNLTVTAPTNFEVCKTSGGTYTSSVTLTPSSGTVSSTIYVRLAAGKDAGTYGGASTYITVSGGGTITKNVSVQGTVTGGGPTPTITVSKTSIAFGDQKMGTNYQGTFTVSGSDLSADINLSVGGANPTLFSIDKTSLPQDGGTVSTTTITVTWTPSASYNAATITISSTGATSKTVTLSGTGKWEVVWKNDGVTHATTLVASGTKPTFPSTPTSCDATSTDFVGWTNAEWSGKIDNVAGKTIHTNNTTMDNVSANGTIYYAVFAEADFEEGPAVGTTIYAEDFSGYAKDAVPSGTITNSHTGTTLYTGSVTYACTNGGGTTKVYLESTAGGTSPELLVANTSGTFSITGIPRCGASELTLSYKQNAQSLTSSVSGTGYSGGKGTSTSGTTSTDIICGSGSTFNLTFTGPSGNKNVRLDDISITVKTKAGSYVQYLTNCCTSYDITKAEGGTVGGGTFSADATSACEGATVTLSTSICSGYTIGAWDVYKTGASGTKISVSGSGSGATFTMPAYGVTVALSTTAKVDHFKDAMHETSGYTGDGYAVSGCNQTVPSLSNTTPASECEGEHYQFVGWVDDAHVDSDGTLLSGYSIVSGGTTSWNATGTTYYAIWAKEL